MQLLNGKHEEVGTFPKRFIWRITPATHNCSHDQGIELHDDHCGKVQSSMICEDNFFNQDFTMANYEEILSIDDVMTNSAPIARGRAMASKEDVFVINQLLRGNKQFPCDLIFITRRFKLNIL